MISQIKHDRKTQKHKTSPMSNYSSIAEIHWYPPTPKEAFLLALSSLNMFAATSSPQKPQRQGTHSSAVSGPKSIDKIGMPVVHSCTHTSQAETKFRVDEVHDFKHGSSLKKVNRHKKRAGNRTKWAMVSVVIVLLCLIHLKYFR